MTPYLATIQDSFSQLLLKWYYTEARDLPWRREPSLYKTVISEFMLQQTQVKTVLPYFAKWLEVFPDFQTLANAPESVVLKQWEGLGYYNRARNLHKLVKKYAECLNNNLPLPKTDCEWLEYPGVGPYTSAAISSIAHNYPAAVVDGNVVRVLSRILAVEAEYGSNAVACKSITPVAQLLVSTENPGDYNQAIMELGATICTKANPSCEECPLQSYCLAFKQNKVAFIPKILRRKSESVTIHRAWMQKEGLVLLQKRPEDATRLANLYEIPSIDAIEMSFNDVCFAPLLMKRKRGISNELITEYIYQVDVNPVLEGRIEASQQLEWLHIDDLDAITLCGPHRKWAQSLIEQA